MGIAEDYIKKSKYFEYMLPPEGVEVRERLNDFIWFDDDGVLCSVPKEKMIPQTMEESREEVRKWDEEFGIFKICMINVVNPHAKSTKEQRDYIADIFPKYVKAIALINNSALGRMAINLFIGLRPPSYPLKTFKDYESAKEWVNQYLEEK